MLAYPIISLPGLLFRLQNLAPSATLVLVVDEQVRIDTFSLMPSEIGLAIQGSLFFNQYLARTRHIQRRLCTVTEYESHIGTRIFIVIRFERYRRRLWYRRHGRSKPIYIV